MVSSSEGQSVVSSGSVVVDVVLLGITSSIVVSCSFLFPLVTEFLLSEPLSLLLGESSTCLEG